ncbi:MAG: efflux RND transporter periplasmic adaptor subunit, partial [Nitrospiraceae bacterium]
MKNQNKRNKTLFALNRRTADIVKRVSHGIFLAGLVTIFLAGCSGKKAEQPKMMPAVPVTVGVVSQKTVPVQLRAIGNVEAFSTVGIKAQINGTLAKAHFTEGQDVKKGSLLFTIDPRPFEAALRQAEAALARDRAQFENAKKDAARYADLVKKGYVSQEQYEQFRTNAEALESVVQADMAQIETAKIQLGYCSVYAPISGRTGSLLLHEGNLVKANADTPMVVINQIQPIYISFSVPEQYLLDIKKYSSAGKLKVEVAVPGDEAHQVEGELSFVDNTVDIATGTIKLKGTFANTDKRLWPGQFTNVSMTLTSLRDAVAVPTQALQTGQEGQYVFVVKQDNTVEQRKVAAGISFADETVVEKGLAPGEQVVTDGQMRLMPGAKVAVRQPGQQAPAGQAAAPQKDNVLSPGAVPAQKGSD